MPASESSSEVDVEDVDVLIVGAGPSGLALANWFRHSKIKVCLVEKKPWTTPRGQAEGIKSSTLEMFDTAGVGAPIWYQSSRIEEQAIWSPKAVAGDDSTATEIVRESILTDKVPELNKPRIVMIQQARVELHLLQNLKSSTNIECRFSTVPTELNIHDDKVHIPEAHPIVVRLSPYDRKKGKADHDAVNHSAETEWTAKDISAQHNGQPPSIHQTSSDPSNHSVGTEATTQPARSHEVHTKYVVACDGAHSWTREQLGVQLKGDLSDSVFGVIDFVPKTNFPDARKMCYIRALNGTILLIPRSRGEIRLYVPVEEGSALSSPKDLTFDAILSAARKIFAPYTLDVMSCSWWSAYRVGQRVGDNFSVMDRAFLCGDAVHTHSPKAGQGMNMGIQDAWNLGWKLRLVLEGRAPAALLSTYDSERRPVAEDFIAFDRGFLKLFSSHDDSFKSKLAQGKKFATGISICYPPSEIVKRSRDPPTQGGPPEGAHGSTFKVDLVPGKRLLDFQMVGHVDAVPTQVHRRLHAGGAFRVLIFAGDIGREARFATLSRIGAWLANPAGLGLLTRGGRRALLEPLVIHTADRASREIFDFPEVFRPFDEVGGMDYWRIFADEQSALDGHGEVYKSLELDEERGALVVVRPDGYIGAVLGLEDLESLKEYFGLFNQLAH